MILLVPLNESKYFEKIIYVHQRNNNNCVDATVVITAGTEFHLVLIAFWIPEKRLFKFRHLVCFNRQGGHYHPFRTIDTAESSSVNKWCVLLTPHEEWVSESDFRIQR